MWEKWTKLCQANVDHYNNHPREHAAIVAGIALVGLVVFGGIAYMGNKESERYPYGLEVRPRVK